MDQKLVDEIYECSFAPERWPNVLDQLARISDALGGTFFVASSTKVESWTASESLRAGIELFARSDLVTRGQRVTRLRAVQHAGFVLEPELYGTEEEMAADPVYSEFLWPAGLGWGTGTAVPLPTGDTLCLTLERVRTRGPVEASIIEQLDAFRPHLARSALMSARLQLERARVASETLALLGLPALVFDHQGKVLAANHLIEALTDHIRWQARDRISLKDSGAHSLLRQAVANLDVEGATPVLSFASRGVAASAAMVVHIVPIRGLSRDIFQSSAGVLLMMPVTFPQAPPVELVRSLFDLTPAEARVARSLAVGKTVDEIASDSHISPNTIRTHVRGILEKTGCSRQTEVVALLTGLSSTRLNDPG
ncbi:helix-turn-helix transcriptional regulator [Bradyrhizobium genosp. P]|uniref:helix-turn-helix transcriptional regulator n=1 Tax=Bradyrhizobium genosp. P TaxID=83641 RepID=UPI003CE95EAE